MTRFTEKANAITPNRELQPDEYFNETDHLIYCSKCNTPRQCRHELQGKVLIPSIRCKCQQEIFEQEETQRKLHEKQMEIEHLFPVAYIIVCQFYFRIDAVIPGKSVVIECFVL